jgi:hypothetical protein
MFSLFYDFYIDSGGKKSAYFIIFYREVFFIFGKIFLLLTKKIFIFLILNSILKILKY